VLSGYMPRGNALAIPATWNLLLGRVLSPCNAPVFPTGGMPENARKTVPSVVPRCRVWCRTVRTDLHRFARNCMTECKSMQPKARAINAKKPQENLGFLQNAVFFSIYESGETGIRTLGTCKGTPVFKTGREIA